MCLFIWLVESVVTQREMQCANVLTPPVQSETLLNQYNVIDFIIISSFLVRSSVVVAGNRRLLDWVVLAVL